jgi:hypothetical protein
MIVMRKTFKHNKYKEVDSEGATFYKILKNFPFVTKIDSLSKRSKFEQISPNTFLCTVF